MMAGNLCIGFFPRGLRHDTSLWVSSLSPQSPTLFRAVGNLDLQPEVPDVRRGLTTESSKAVSSHEKKQQSLAKFITAADIEGIGAGASAQQDIVIKLA